MADIFFERERPTRGATPRTGERESQTRLYAEEEREG